MGALVPLCLRSPMGAASGATVSAAVSDAGAVADVVAREERSAYFPCAAVLRAFLSVIRTALRLWINSMGLGKDVTSLLSTDISDGIVLLRVRFFPL
jgi:hypothetical protein